MLAESAQIKIRKKKNQSFPFRSRKDDTAKDLSKKKSDKPLSHLLDLLIRIHVSSFAYKTFTFHVVFLNICII